MKTILSVFFCLLTVLLIGYTTSEAAPMRDAILQIEKEVTDLTSPLSLLFWSKSFPAIAKTVTPSNAIELVETIQAGQFTDTQTGIALYIMAYALPEKDYWRITSPLLSSKTKQSVLADVLCPPMPFGPGFANAYNISPYKEQLDALATQNGVIPTTNLLNEIRSGRMADLYKLFREDPRKANYPPAVTNYFKK